MDLDGVLIDTTCTGPPTFTNGLRAVFQRIRRELEEFFFEYETMKVVRLYNPGIGLINRIAQIGALVTIVGYFFIYSKGYQSFYNGESATVVKIKGLIKKSMSQNVTYVWDTTDLVIPALENGASFIATNVIETPVQEVGNCAEEAGHPFVTCVDDADCIRLAGSLTSTSTFLNGFPTGVCIKETHSCEINGWCPVEHDKPPDFEFDVLHRPPLFLGVENFTILVKNYITFPEINIKRRSILENISDDHLHNCHYDPSADPYCPVFRIKDIVRLAKQNFSEIARTGAVMAFHINWECDFDYHERHCLPKYEFLRMDSAEKVAGGWSFRHAHYWNAPESDGSRLRMLQKYYGIRIVYIVNARAGKFNVVTCAMNIGSGIGLLGFATILCDFITMHMMGSSFFRARKVEKIREQRQRKRTKKCIREAEIYDVPLTPEILDFILKNYQYALVGNGDAQSRNAATNNIPSDV